MSLKDFLRFRIWAKWKLNHFPSFYSSHSQFGEDMFLRSVFNNSSHGFYVDIGAHHPVYYSNTYHFYLKGWRGINVDAAPGSMDLFKTIRREDTNIEACLGPENGQEIDFYLFEKAALNTFDKDMARKAQQNSKLLGVEKLKTKTLESILDEHLPQGQKIDFLSVDVEGLDEMILKSNNWTKYSPEIVLFEEHGLKLENLNESAIIRFLQSHNYEVIGKMGPSFAARLRK